MPKKEISLKTAVSILKGLLPSMTDDDASKIANDLLLAKADVGHATPLDGAEIHDDRWTAGEMHRVPSREEINIGPVEAATGGNAPRMISQYSNPAPQHGVAQEAEKLGEMMGQLKSYMKSLAAHQEVLAKNAKLNNQLLMAVLAKAEDDDDDDDKDDEDMKAKKSASAAKAKSRLKKASDLLDKADMYKSLADDSDDATERKFNRNMSKSLRKAAAKLLVKASNDALIARKDGVAVTKSIVELIGGNALLKAEVNIAKAEDEKDEEEDEEAKAKKALEDSAAAAKSAGKNEGDKGNQADHAEENGNQADEAAKAQAALIETTLKGHGVLEGKINQVMDLIMGKPAVNATPVPVISSLMKGDVTKIAAGVNDRIDDAQDNGKLDFSGAMSARDLLKDMTAVQAGVLSEAIFRDKLAGAPHAVQDVFNLAA